jgi:hypothetical protein
MGADARTKRYKKLLAEVNAVLYDDWAPIGFKGYLPKDEYEPDAARIVSLLTRSCSEGDIVQLLSTSEAGLNAKPTSVAKARAIARKLMALGAGK